MAQYPGGKNGSGVHQAIINLMPPHDNYIEGCLGSGAILRHKKPASGRNIGIEKDSDVIQRLWIDSPFEIIQGDIIKLLARASANLPVGSKTLLYIDPPYLLSSRSAKQAIYKCEMLTEKEHTNLLKAILKLNCYVMISGYHSKLYASVLAHWREETYQTTNRAGKQVTESVWCNFPVPVKLHDYSFLGANFSKRQDIKRQRERWRERLLKMDSHKRYALIAEIENL